jgi:FdhD protein
MTRRFPIARFRDGVLRTEEDCLSVEEPLLVRVNGQPLATLMRTPGSDQTLVEGFLFSEGLISAPADVASFVSSTRLDSQEALVELAAHCKPGPTAARSVYLSSSCGVCGRSSIRELLERLEPIPPIDVDPGWLAQLPERVREAQVQFPVSGGVHAAALFGANGNLLGLEEDVGRHNALDKLVGKAFRQQALPLNDSILVMSSRASFDIVQKAAMAGIPVVATMGAASSLAAELAASAGVQLFCFLRPGSVVRMGDSRVGSNP